jgi:hypothetical protein
MSTRSAADFMRQFKGKDSQMFFDAVMGDGAFEDLLRTSPKKIKTVRNFLETSSPTTQCNNVVGKLVPGRTPCWICGKTIQQNQTGACEHVLPAIQAFLLMDLYSPERAKGYTNPQEEYIPWLKYEYGWAHHEPCNSLKTNILLIDKSSDLHAPFTINEVNLDLLLQEIKKYEGFTDINIKQRKNAIIQQYLQPILKEVNDAPALRILSSFSSLIHEALTRSDAEFNSVVQSIAPTVNQGDISVSLAQMMEVYTEVLQNYVTVIANYINDERITYTREQGVLQAILNTTEVITAENLAPFIYFFLIASYEDDRNFIDTYFSSILYQFTQVGDYNNGVSIATTAILWGILRELVERIQTIGVKNSVFVNRVNELYETQKGLLLAMINELTPDHPLYGLGSVIENNSKPASPEEIIAMREVVNAASLLEDLKKIKGGRRIQRKKQHRTRKQKKNKRRM